MKTQNDDSPLNDIKIGEITATWSKANNFKTNYFTTTDSTNIRAKKLAFEQEELENEFVLYIADNQTQGRGRFDRTWTSPHPGCGLLSTWSFSVSHTPSPHATAKVGMALYNAAKATWQSLPFSLKAPNDLFLADKKIAGILVETVSQGSEHRLLIGVGFNVLNHPNDITASTHLVQHLPRKSPLLGEDWILFVDRFLFELTMLVPSAHEELSTTQEANFISLINLNPLLEKKLTSFSEIVKNI
jgi:BirA family biotin operon repressor/biotin-[acetyl-CoA-carboxylase] ligase